MLELFAIVFIVILAWALVAAAALLLRLVVWLVLLPFRLLFAVILFPLRLPFGPLSVRATGRR
jgi:hypothetical protein